MPPTAIIPIARGGIAAEWRIAGYDLEIECDPDGTTEYNFARPDVKEFSAPVDPESPQQWQHVAVLPKRAE